MQKDRTKKMGQLASAAVLIFMVFLCFHIKDQWMNQTLFEQALSEGKRVLFHQTARQYAMQIGYIMEQDGTKKTAAQVLLELSGRPFPLTEYIDTAEGYETQVESHFSYEEIVAMEASDEPDAADGTALNGENGGAGVTAGAGGCSGTATAAENAANSQTTVEFQVSQAPKTDIPLDKLNDFDYLIHNFYVVDKTTTITGEQLNASELLARDMRLAAPTGQPQILIYHTHSQEGYADSVPGDPNTTVVGVGNYLTELLQERYGLSVLHHTGEYDVNDRDHAYAKAGPALEQILAENPGIEVVIDLHRDGVADTTRLVADVNGKQMASIMFFNGLSRTTATGDIPYLYNPNLSDNLAFSLQMQLKAKQYYPGFSRSIYLKGYRYNMHYCPKTLLVEVGAQTNTVDEAMSAMEPLADILYRVLTGN